MAKQCLSTAFIKPHHCSHRTWAVLSSDKHWHVELEHCSALLDSYDSSTALSLAAVVSWSQSWVTVKHCFMTSHCLRERLLQNMEISGAVLEALLACALTQCLTEPRIFSLSCGWGTRSLLKTPLDSIPSTYSIFFTQTRRIPARNIRCNTSFYPMLHHYTKERPFIK